MAAAAPCSAARRAAAAGWRPPVCYKFPQLSVCGCTTPCRKAVVGVALHPVAHHVVVGSIEGATSLPLLLAAGITHILDLSSTPYVRHNDLFTYASIALDDHPDAPIAAAVAEGLAFIDAAAPPLALDDRSPARVLVHCRAGVSRSVALCAAWLVLRAGLSPDAALAHLRLVRGPRAEPNPGFDAFLRSLTPSAPPAPLLIPDAILARILSLAVAAPRDAATLATVSPRFARLVASNAVWRPLFCSAFRFGRLNACPAASGSWRDAYLERMAGVGSGAPAPSCGAKLTALIQMVSADITPEDVKVDGIDDTPRAPALRPPSPSAAPPPPKPWARTPAPATHPRSSPPPSTQ